MCQHAQSRAALPFVPEIALWTLKQWLEQYTSPVDCAKCKEASAGTRDAAHLGSLLEGHGARDGAVAKALLLELHLEPVYGAGKLAEDQRLG